MRDRSGGDSSETAGDSRVSWTSQLPDPMPTLFEKIIAREIPADIVYEDDRCIAFRDIAPQAPMHVLVVPKKVLTSVDAITEADEALVGHLFVVAATVAAQDGRTGGYRTVFNTGRDAGQTVEHLHLHVLAGRPLAWPPG